MKDFILALLDDHTDKNVLLRSPIRHQSGNELFFVTTGYLVRECNFNAIRLNEHDIHLSLARQATSVKEFSPDLQGYYCRFEDSFLERIYLKDSLEKELEFISSFLSRYPLKLTLKVSERLRSNFTSMWKLYNEHPIDDALIHTYLVASIFEIRKLMIESHLNFYPSKAFLTTKRYNDLLSKYVHQERSINYYAQQLNMTSNHLNKSVKAVTGRTAISLLNEMSILDAKMRLKYTNHTINEIAFQLGFDDQSYFSRFFKKSTGQTPSGYRKEEEK